MTVPEIIKNNPLLQNESVNKWIDRMCDTYGKNRSTFERRYYRIKKQHIALEEEAEKIGIPVESISHYWHKGQHFSIFSKANHKTYFDLRDDIVADMKKYAPKIPQQKRVKTKDSYLLVIDPADIHIGKLCKAIETGEEYNSEVAVQRITEGLSGLLQRVSSFNFDEVLLIIGNDILHTDNAKRTTTSGTPQDTEGMWYNNFLVAKDIYIKVIERLLPIAKVTVKHNPSNHDYTHGFFLADTISSWFSKCKDITFDVTPSHRKYHVYGKNLIGTTHGDGAKLHDLPLLMAQEASEHWHTCMFRYWYDHHIHHKRSKEIGSVTIESMRSPSGTDSWHHRNGYQHTAKAIEAFIHCKENGQIARFTHIFK